MYRLWCASRQQYTFIKSVLDAGADGIIVPQVRTVREVRQIVCDCRYPPLCQRGYGPRVTSNYGRNGGVDYIAQANLEVFVSVQIETTEALAALDKILAVSGEVGRVVAPGRRRFRLSGHSHGSDYGVDS